jgi:peroxiredoxin
MTTRRSIVSLIGLTVMMSAAAAFTAPNQDVKAKVGEAAPNFTLKDASGKAHSLADYKGRIVVMQWINPDCPVCRRVSSSGLVATMAKELKGIDSNIVHLTVNSTSGMAAEKSAGYLKQNKIDAPALIDDDGTVGHMYGAMTTPHLFVIDAEGVLRYQGAFDDDPNGNKKDATNYVVNAVQQIKAGETVSPDYAKPYGCSVKYKK